MNKKAIHRVAFVFIAMTALSYSFIVPVYNRPQELQELLESMGKLRFDRPFEVVVIEDGSTESSEQLVHQFKHLLSLSYFQKENTGPGDSRNYGMQRAKGDYFIVLDSDCVLPEQYLEEVDKELSQAHVDFFGGPDDAHASFSAVQKAINYSMTSFFTTGGIRGNDKQLQRFQPRSFNMGMSKRAFETSGGFGDIHPGEDPDLTFRLWEQGFTSRLFPNAFVYHKRRIDWKRFYHQVRKFGLVRPILSQWHPQTAKVTYWFPSLFLLGLGSALVFGLIGVYFPLYVYLGYFTLLFLESFYRNKSLSVAFLSIVAVIVQFFGYGTGFLMSTLLLNFSRKRPRELFPKLFFTK